MKKHILFSLILLQAALLSAQTTNYRLIGYTIDVDSLGDWEPYKQFTYTYAGDRGGLYTHQLYPYFRGEMNFDEGLELIWMEDMYDPQYQATRVYDAENLVIEEVTLAWNATTSSYDNFRQEIFTNEDGKLIKKNKNQWDGSAYIPEDEIEYTYSGDLLVERLEKNYTGSEFENSSQTLFSYDSEDQFTTVEVKQWNGTGWEDFLRYTYSFNASGNCTDITFERNQGGGLENYYQVLYNYVDETLISYERKLYDGTSWVEDILSTVSWDVNNNLSEIIRMTWNEVSEYENYERYLFTYEEYEITSLETAVNTRFSAFPNPTTGSLFVQSPEILTSLTVYNLTGETVFYTNVNSTRIMINLETISLEKGLYFIKATYHSGSLIHKIILQ